VTSRSLFLAGGGLKIAYQAGVLQVWLDEAGIEFDHVDAVSAASFNLAMWCSGQNGTQIADHWRTFRPLAGIAVNWRGVAAGPFGSSVLTLDRLRRNVIPTWELDFDVIRRTDRSATFNVYNFSRQRLEALPAADMDEQRLLAAAALPMWFPPVEIGGDTYVDAIHATPANLRLALARGADELWVIWTTSTAGRWRNGYVSQYFQIFEETTNAQLRSVLADVEANNLAHAQGEQAQFGRHIDIQLLQAEVPLHYLLNFSARKFPAAVDLGVQHAREWCRARGLLEERGDKPRTATDHGA
jgi:predicted acylesterase/phospholipase RssA